MDVSDSVHAFLDSQRIGHLATADADGAPHVVPVVYAWLDGAAYIAIDEKPKTTLRLRRIRNIEANPRAALVVDVYDEDWSRLAWVMIRGRAEVLEADSADGLARRQGIAALRDRYAQQRSMALEERPLIRLTAERVDTWGALDR